MGAQRTAPDHDGIAIVGLAGVVSPAWHRSEAFWANIRHGVDAVTTDVPPNRWDPVFFDPMETRAPTASTAGVAGS